MFGTSGIRGQIGEDVTAETALSIGRAVATQGGDDSVSVVLGRDARESGEVLELAVSAGLRGCGADVLTVGCVSTPTVAHAVRTQGADAGIMLTASHNLDRLDRWEDGEEIPHVINFQNPSDLRALLTDRRVELLKSIMTGRPDSIRQLTERLGRDVKSIHNDLQVLADHDIVHFEQAGRAKRPFVPYDTIDISLEISTPRPSDDAPV